MKLFAFFLAALATVLIAKVVVFNYPQTKSLL
jgi:hypothetical protein